MKYLFMVGIALVIFGICFLITFSKEKAKKYALVQGKVKLYLVYLHILLAQQYR